MSLLAGIKVVDLSRILAGPWATQLLADYGAEVIKIEHPNGGDDTRQWGPPYVEIDGEPVAAYFTAANRGKRSYAIDIASPEGQAQIKNLIQEADVLVENFKVGGLDKYGLDYAELSKINPQLIYCSITGFGQTGPMARTPGYDAMIQAAGGLMSITGKPDAEGGEPTKVGVAVTDLMTGMYAANAILAAIIYRNKTGEGQHIDLSLFDCQLAMLANQGANYLATGESPTRLGNAHPNIVPYQTFECDDGYLMIAVGNDRQFKALCFAFDLAELADEQRFCENSERVNNRKTLIDILSAKVITQSRKHWLEKLKNAGVPCSPVNSVGEALESDQAKAREMVCYFNDNKGGSRYVANPVKFSKMKPNSVERPPKLGESD